MAMNHFQFQHGMSPPDFHRRFGTKQQCAEAVMAVHGPQGSCCPRGQPLPALPGAHHSTG
jgi:hypothetical protein